MKKLLFFLLVLMPLCGLRAQDSCLRAVAPGYFVSTDVVYDVESIPVISCEKLFITSKRLKGLQLSVAYQVHYNDQFGIVTSHGDRVSIGVYQGPAARLGYHLYSHRHRARWSNYFSPALGVKYLWYNTDSVKTARRQPSMAFRLQSEKCLDFVPQFSVGAKRIYKHFCADFYVGLQFPIKLRNKYITLDQNAMGVENPHVPYYSNVTQVAPAPLVGIRLGYISRRGMKKAK